MFNPAFTLCFTNNTKTHQWSPSKLNFRIVFRFSVNGKNKILIPTFFRVKCKNQKKSPNAQMLSMAIWYFLKHFTKKKTPKKTDLQQFQLSFSRTTGVKLLARSLSVVEFCASNLTLRLFTYYTLLCTKGKL